MKGFCQISRSGGRHKQSPEPLARAKYGGYASLRFNHLQPPIDDPAPRRAVLKAVQQSDFMIAAARRGRPDLPVVQTSGYTADTLVAGNIELPVPRKPYGERELLRLLKASLT